MIKVEKIGGYWRVTYKGAIYKTCTDNDPDNPYEAEDRCKEYAQSFADQLRWEASNK